MAQSLVARFGGCAGFDARDEEIIPLQSEDGRTAEEPQQAAWSADLLRVPVAAPTIRAAAESWQREPMGELDKILVAIARSNLRVLKELVNKGNVNARVEDGFSLLMNAAMDDECDPQVVSLLVDRGANVAAAEEGQQYTALHFAARQRT